MRRLSWYPLKIKQCNHFYVYNTHSKVGGWLLQMARCGDIAKLPCSIWASLVDVEIIGQMNEASKNVPKNAWNSKETPTTIDSSRNRVKHMRMQFMMTNKHISYWNAAEPSLSCCWKLWPKGRTNPQPCHACLSKNYATWLHMPDLGTLVNFLIWHLFKNTILCNATWAVSNIMLHGIMLIS